MRFDHWWSFILAISHFRRGNSCVLFPWDAPFKRERCTEESLRERERGKALENNYILFSGEIRLHLLHTDPYLLSPTPTLFLSAYLSILIIKKYTVHTLIKKKIKFSSYIRKLGMEQLQSHIWLTASSYMGKYLRISSCIRKPFLIYDFATAHLWISLYTRKIFFFYQCRMPQLQLY